MLLVGRRDTKGSPVLLRRRGRSYDQKKVGSSRQKGPFFRPEGGQTPPKGHFCSPKNALWTGSHRPEFHLNLKFTSGMASSSLMKSFVGFTLNFDFFISKVNLSGS